MGSGATVVRLGALTKRQQADCGVDWALSTTTTDQYSTSTPQGTIVKSAIEVRLPSVSSLNDNIQHEYAQAADPYSTFSKMGDTALGVLLGGMGSVMGLSGILTIVERRRNQVDPALPANPEVAS